MPAKINILAWVNILSLSALVQFIPVTSLAQACLELEAGFDVSYFVYQESLFDSATLKKQFFMKNYGVFAGVNGSVSYYGQVFLKFESSYKAGEVTYESNGTGTSVGINCSITNIRGLIGYTTLSCHGVRITPYSGIAYRYLYDNAFDDGRLSSQGAYGYDRESNYFYLPFGLELQCGVNAYWAVGIITELDCLWAGFQESHLEQINAVHPVLNKQNEGWGGRVSFRVTRCLSSNRKIMFESYFRHWDIACSELGAATMKGSAPTFIGVEPKNTTNDVGIKCVWLFEGLS